MWLDWAEQRGTHDVALLLYPLRQSFIGAVAVHPLTRGVEIQVAFTLGRHPDRRVDERGALSTQTLWIEDRSVVICGFDVVSGWLPQGVSRFGVDL